MGEIKSTLDLVMERTRHLTLSEEEKQSSKAKAAGQQFKGLMQKFEDQRLREADLLKEWQALQTRHPGVNSDAYLGFLADRIDLAALGGPLPALFEILFDRDSSPLSNLAAEYRQALMQAKAKFHETARASLTENLGVSGSAMVPMIEGDPRWQSARETLDAVFQQKLQAEKIKLV